MGLNQYTCGYGDIVLSTSRSNFLSRCIRWFTAANVSHSFITLPSILGVQMCMEAEAGGVDSARFDTNYLLNPDEVLQIWVVNVPQATKDAAIRQLLNDLEVSYGFFEYPWFIWRALNRWVGRDIKSQDNWNQDGMICSQLVVAFLKACGLERVFEGYGEGSIAPADLEIIFRNFPQYFTRRN